uniref:(northern house mosquito) hypothetical protein n=1 Tax=Culex pipiens TaxID=7175 RepID=A0A8D8IT01_CULPI
MPEAAVQLNELRSANGGGGAFFVCLCGSKKEASLLLHFTILVAPRFSGTRCSPARPVATSSSRSTRSTETACSFSRRTSCVDRMSRLLPKIFPVGLLLLLLLSFLKFSFSSRFALISRFFPGRVPPLRSPAYPTAPGSFEGIFFRDPEWSDLLSLERDELIELR